ncbi:MAG TPA: hypothetical protein VIG49_10625 [Acetobacteraceae bacterium]
MYSDPGYLDPGHLEIGAAALARLLASACPRADYGDVGAFDACVTALKETRDIPSAKELAWGTDQPSLPIDKRILTRLTERTFRSLYLPLFTFTGRWSVAVDRHEHTPYIVVEAYFRNSLPAGEYPYPFWHSPSNWSDYEATNQLRFYLDRTGRAFVVTHSGAGSDADRGAYAHVTRPAFDGQWQWLDDAERPEPRVSLFPNVYSEANPNLARLQNAYESFALEIRQGTCLDCHTPVNRAAMERLVLLQTPVHAAGAIDKVIKEVKSGKMPQDDLGLRKHIDPRLRAAIIRSAEAFRDEVRLADRWESDQHAH